MHNKIREKITSPEVWAKTEKVLDKVNHIARETHKRHVTIKDRHHRSFIKFPMSLGIALTLILPVFAAAGLAAFLMNDWRVHVEKQESE